MATIQFFFSAERQDIVATINGVATDAIAVGDTAICFEGAEDVGYFGADAELAKHAIDSFLRDYEKFGLFLFLMEGGYINNVPQGYELLYTADA